MTAVKRIGELEEKYVLEVLQTRFRSSSGANMMKRLEDKFCELTGAKYAIAHVNGTATLHTALVAGGVRPGDEVIVPPLTMSSTSFAVIQAGATPIFADVDRDNFQLDPKSVAERITTKTRAIMPVDLYGGCPDMDKLVEIAAKHKLFIVEDAAQTFLSKWKGRVVGTIGEFGSFSFQASKHLTAGEGGMLCTNDLELATRARRFNSLGYAGVGANVGKIRRQDIQHPDYLRHVSVGYNYRMPELCAAVLLAQIERAPQLVARRVHIAKKFRETVGDRAWIRPQLDPQGCENSYWTPAFRLDLKKFDRPWAAFRDKFEELGGDGIYAAWQLTYLEPAFQTLTKDHPEYAGRVQKYDKGLCPVAEELQRSLLQFKSSYWDDDERLEKQLKALRATLDYFDKS
jgi:perosamine synthetase